MSGCNGAFTFSNSFSGLNDLSHFSLPGHGNYIYYLWRRSRPRVLCCWSEQPTPTPQIVPEGDMRASKGFVPVEVRVGDSTLDPRESAPSCSGAYHREVRARCAQGLEESSGPH